MERPKSIRGVLAWLASALIGVAALAALDFVLTNALVRRIVDERSAAVRSVQAVEELELAVLLAQRASSARVLDPERAPPAEDAWGEVERWLTSVEDHAETPGEQAIVASIGRNVVEIRARWARAGPVVTVDELREIDRSLWTTLADMEALVELNLAQVAAAEDAVDRWRRLTDGVSLAIASLVLVLVALGLGWVRSALYRPVEDLRAAMRRFGSGEVEARAPVDGPVEIEEVARTFNDVADALVRQREGQLALVASVAHDLRNPLFAVELTATRSLRDPEATERERELARRIRTQLRHVTRILGDLVDTTRIEAGHLELRPEPSDLRRLVEDCVRLYEGTSPRHEVVLAEAPPRLDATVDPTRITQVVSNLVSNAVKYSPDGGRIELRLRAEGADAVLSVSDHGVGIPPEQVDRVFEPFQRLGGTRAAGAGLGLSACKRIVEAHHGRIALESEPGHGTTVEVRLPLAA